MFVNNVQWYNHFFKKDNINQCLNYCFLKMGYGPQLYLMFHFSDWNNPAWKELYSFFLIFCSIVSITLVQPNPLSSCVLSQSWKRTFEPFGKVNIRNDLIPVWLKIINICNIEGKTQQVTQQVFSANART